MRLFAKGRTMAATDPFGAAKRHDGRVRTNYLELPKDPRGAVAGEIPRGVIGAAHDAATNDHYLMPCLCPVKHFLCFSRRSQPLALAAASLPKQRPSQLAMFG